MTAECCDSVLDQFSLIGVKLHFFFMQCEKRDLILAETFYL